MIKVLVVDDSPLFAEAVSAVVDQGRDMRCVGVASDGRQAIEMTTRLRPDIISMDIQMPVMDGLEAIERIMASDPTPIVVMTADPRGYSGNLNFEALRRGALDLIHKPQHFPSSDTEAAVFRERLAFLARIPVVRHVAGRLRAEDALASPKPVARHKAERIVGIVASTGGPAALASILESLPADFGAGIAVVQHMAPGFIHGLVSWLDRSTPLEVSVAKQGDLIRPGKVVFAPDESHLKVSLHGRVSLIDQAAIGGHKPSGTLLLGSMASALRKRAIGVVLTGMGDDGASGLLDIKDRGGSTLSQDEESCVVYGMPKVAYDTGASQQRVALDRIPEALLRLAGTL